MDVSIFLWSRHEHFRPIFSKYFSATWGLMNDKKLSHSQLFKLDFIKKMVQTCAIACRAGYKSEKKDESAFAFWKELWRNVYEE